MDDLTKELKEESEKLTDEYFCNPTSMDYMVVNSILVRGFIMGCNHAKGIFYPKLADPVAAVAEVSKGLFEKAMSGFVPLGKK
jgi:hypothetical protein